MITTPSERPQPQPSKPAQCVRQEHLSKEFLCQWEQIGVLARENPPTCSIAGCKNKAVPTPDGWGFFCLDHDGRGYRVFKYDAEDVVGLTFNQFVMRYGLTEQNGLVNGRKRAKLSLSGRGLKLNMRGIITRKKDGT